MTGQPDGPAFRQLGFEVKSVQLGSISITVCVCVCLCERASKRERHVTFSVKVVNHDTALFGPSWIIDGPMAGGARCQQAA